jgi:hypothetical protein
VVGENAVVLVPGEFGQWRLVAFLEQPGDNLGRVVAVQF